LTTGRWICGVIRQGETKARDARPAHACSSFRPTNQIQARMGTMHYQGWQRLKALGKAGVITCCTNCSRDIACPPARVVSPEMGCSLPGFRADVWCRWSPKWLPHLAPWCASPRPCCLYRLHMRC
jgi:hypothetical protein